MATGFSISPGGSDSKKSKVSLNDAVPGYLNGKLVAGANVTLTEGSDGADETLTVAAGAGGSVTVEENNVALGAAATLDYLGQDFDLSLAGGEAEIAVAAAHTGLPHGTLPSGAGGTTVDATGEACVDSTSKTVNFYDGANEVVLNPVQIKSFVLIAPVAADDYPLIKFPYAVTLLQVDYVILGATNWIGQLQEADADGANGADTQAADSTATTTNTQVTSFSNAVLDAGDYLNLKTTSISGTPTSLTVTIQYRQNA